MVGSNVMDGRDKGMFWNEWEVFFGLRFKGELTDKGAVLISEGISLITVLGSKSSNCISSAINYLSEIHENY